MSVPPTKIGGMETHQGTAPALLDQLPDHAVHCADEPELVLAWNHEFTERQAQAAKVESLLRYKTQKLAQKRGQHTFSRRAVEKAITRDIATFLGLTEAAVRRLLGTAEFLTEKLPKTWKTYQSGLIDRERAAKAAQAVEDIAHREDLLSVIDAEIAERAPRENAASLHKWVAGRVAELDAECFQERYDRAQAKRYVNFHHLGNGMSRIEALIPTLLAAELEQQIYAQARNAPRKVARPLQPGSSDPGATQDSYSPGLEAQERTLSQRIADAFINRMNIGQPNPAESDSAGPTNVKIGLLVPVQTLSGDSDAPALSWDRSWSLPAGTARQIALDPQAEHDWYVAGAAPEILTVVHPRTGPGDQPLEEWINNTDPQQDNLLTRAYRSRTSRDRQRDAILIRDGQCTRAGCTNPGWQAEVDHTQSFETGGQTIGGNLTVLCRDCHTIKSHRLDPNHKISSARSARSGDSSAIITGPSGADGNQGSLRNQSRGRRPAAAAARASPTSHHLPGTLPSRGVLTYKPSAEDLPEWLIETRPPPDRAAEGAA